MTSGRSGGIPSEGGEGGPPPPPGGPGAEGAEGGEIVSKGENRKFLKLLGGLVRRRKKRSLIVHEETKTNLKL